MERSKTATEPWNHPPSLQGSFTPCLGGYVCMYVCVYVGWLTRDVTGAHMLVPSHDPHVGWLTRDIAGAHTLVPSHDQVVGWRPACMSEWVCWLVVCVCVYNNLHSKSHSVAISNPQIHGCMKMWRVNKPNARNIAHGLSCALPSLNVLITLLLPIFTKLCSWKALEQARYEPLLAKQSSCLCKCWGILFMNELPSISVTMVSLMNVARTLL
jgi:hypothetical protein